MPVRLMRPLSVGDSDVWVLGAGASKPVAADPGDPLSHDDDTTYIQAATNGDIQDLKLTQLPGGAVGIRGVKGYFRWRSPSDNSMRVELAARLQSTDGAFTADIQNSSGSYTTVEVDPLPRPGGGNWTVSDLADPTLMLRIKVTTEPVLAAVRCTSLWMAVDSIDLPAKIEYARAIASMRLRGKRVVQHNVQLPVTLDMLDYELMDLFNVSHFSLPNTDAPAEHDKNWQRALAQLRSVSLDLQAMKLTHGYRMKRGSMMTDWDISITDRKATARGDGVVRMSKGARGFSRGSVAWIEDPASGKIVEVPIDVEKQDAGGLLIEGSSTGNFLENSAFADGVAADWSSNGTGLNGSAIADDTSATLWDVDLSAQSCKMTAGSPLGGTDLSLDQTANNQHSANTVVCISMTHKDDSGEVLDVEITRDSDGFYWNAGTPAWQAGQVANALTLATTETRASFRNIDVGASAERIKVEIFSRATAGQINHVYDVDVVESPFPTSRKLTRGTPEIATSADELTITNNSTGRVFFESRGTYTALIQAQWNSADLPTGAFKTLLYVEEDSDNYEWIYYDGDNSRFVYRRRLLATNYDATISSTVVARTNIVFGARWTSDQGEEGLTNYTISVFVAGVKGSDATPGGEVSYGATVNMWRGAKASDTDAWDGWLKFHEITQQVLSDEEMLHNR